MTSYGIKWPHNMTPEQSAHRAIQKEMGGSWFYNRIEKNVDVPDVYYKLNGTPGWIELKAAKDNETIKLRPGQLNWITRHGPGAHLIIRQLDHRGRHRQWIGVDCYRTGWLKHLHRPTPDTLILSLPCVVFPTFRETLEEIIRREALGRS